MSTAEKLTYLNDTKTLLKDNINLTGAGLTNQTPFRQYATDLKTALLNILNNGTDILFNNFPKTTGTGTNITLNNTLQAPMRSVINGDTEQQSYSGKNLFDSSIFQNETKDGITITKNNDGTLTINGSNNTNSNISFSYYMVDFPINIIASMSLIKISGTAQESNSEMRFNLWTSNYDNKWSSITESSKGILDNTKEYIRSSIVIYPGTSYSNYKVGLQIVNGSTADYNFEPYVGGTASPNPDYPQDIKSVTGLQTINITGKNIYNPSFRRSNNTIYSTNCTATEENGLFTLEATDADMRMWNTINEGSNYGDTAGQLYELIYDDYSVSISNDLMVKNFITFYDENKVSLGFIQKRNNIFNFSKNDIANAKYFSIRIGYGQAVVGETYSFKVQLEQGSATDYEPYQTPQEYEINLGKNLVDISTADYVYNCTLSNEIYTTNELTSSNRSINFGYNTNDNYTIKPNETYYVSADIRLKSGTSKNVNALRFNVSGLTNTTITNPDFTNEFQRYIFSSKNETASDIVSGRLLLQASTININNAVLEIKNVMISKSNSSYSPYFTPIHLYENDQIIGTPNNWSIKHTKKEVIFDGSENWNMLGSIYNYFQYTPTNLNQNTSDANPMSNYFIKNTAWNERKQGIWFDRNLIIKTNESLNLTQSLSDFKTWLSTHNTKVVYELAEPTTEPITNTELIEDLNNFYNKAKSYNGQTNISVEGDLQMILDVSALKEVE